MRLILALLLILWPGAAAAQDVDESFCTTRPQIPVHVTPVFDEPRYDYSQDLATLQQLARDRTHSIPHYHSATMGLTRYEPAMEMRVPIVIAKFPDGKACARISNVEATVGYHAVTVNIGREIPRNSCAFNEVMAHEMRHVAVNRELPQEMMPQITEKLKAYVRQSGVFQVYNREYAETIARNKVQDILTETMDAMNAENETRQRLIDSEQEYQRMSHVCGGALSALARRSKQGH